MTELDGHELVAYTFELNVLEPDIHLVSAIRKAAIAYCNTPEGRKVYKSENNGWFNWGDFVANVPNEICRSFGFEKLDDSIQPLRPVDFNEQLVVEEDLTDVLTSGKSHSEPLLPYPTYQQLRKAQQEEFDKFPMFAAFNEQQFADGMRKLGLKPTDMDDILGIGFSCFVRRSDASKLAEMRTRHAQELTLSLLNPAFAKDAFVTELSNHEFSYTWDVDPALQALGLSPKDIKENPVLKRALEEAVKIYINTDD